MTTSVPFSRHHHVTFMSRRTLDWHVNIAPPIIPRVVRVTANVTNYLDSRHYIARLTRGTNCLATAAWLSCIVASLITTRWSRDCHYVMHQSPRQVNSARAKFETFSYSFLGVKHSYVKTHIIICIIKFIFHIPTPTTAWASLVQGSIFVGETVKPAEDRVSPWRGR